MVLFTLAITTSREEFMLYLVQFGDLLESRDEFMLYLNIKKSSCYTWI